ncbi:PREDICTED: probable serine/threonine-protein kinase tsuA [Rhagoletis zephyria]|uniref:probable serine/threonine-protein kinase tsuA n=1 Tax=Rhagoletis zephyria TaxID=28612 RepID=UPI00081174A4|nr:PREDICTED: probable serine/threonine-protein kinase tsuA [Rhagoletis zephyria]
MHHNLNHSKGTIFAPCLNDIPEAEIVENMSEQGVVSAYKFVKHIDGQTIASGVVLLTFDLYTLPEKVEVSWYTTKVRPYYPNPMRCRNCQILGHTTKRCNKTPACDSCALPPHTPSPCSRTFCANCAGNHAASNRTCPKFTQMKQIITIKTDKKCSMREAMKIHRMQIPPTLNESSLSFSNATKNSNQQTNSINIINTNDTHVQNNSSDNINKNILTNKASKENTPIAPTISFKSTSTLSSNNNYNSHLKTGFSLPNSSEDNISTDNINTKENNSNTDSTIDLAAINSVDYYTTNPMIVSLLSHLSSSDTPFPSSLSHTENNSFSID